MKSEDRESEGISEIVGAVTLIGVMAVVIAVFSIMVFSGMGGEEVPAVMLASEMISDSGENQYLTISHLGGDELLKSQTVIRINGIIRTDNFTDSSGGSWDSLAAGESISIEMEETPDSILIISNRNSVHPSIIYLFGGENGIIIYNPPIAHFTGNPTWGEEPLTVSFTDQSTGTPDTWYWEFGDGGTSTAQNPVHKYNSSGVYDVRLMASNLYGSGVEFLEDYIVVIHPPVDADFTATPLSGYRPLNVSFTDLSMGSPTNWSWDFGDGNISNEQNPTHIYTSQGTYDVRLLASNSYDSDDEVKTGYIDVTIEPLVAYFIGYPISGPDPLTVEFTDLSTGDGLYLWEWDFGDGSSSAEQNPTHTYTDYGVYNVSLRVENVTGAFDYEIRPGYVNVTEESLSLPYADFSGSPTSGTMYMTVQFEDLSTGDPGYWYWDFGDGSFSTEQNPTHTYSSLLSSSVYDVKLTVTNGAGSDTEIKDDYIVVTGIFSNTGFVGEPASGGAPLTVSFTELTSGLFYSICDYDYYWEFGDGTTSTQQNPVHTYTATGTYTVRLTVSVYLFGFRIRNIEEEKTSYIIVGTLPVAEFSGSLTGGSKPLTVSFTDESTGSPSSWLWDFGDQGTSTDKNPSHLYSLAGDYPVTLSVSNNFGNDTLIKSSYIHVND